MLYKHRCTHGTKHKNKTHTMLTKRNNIINIRVRNVYVECKA